MLCEEGRGGEGRQEERPDLRGSPGGRDLGSETVRKMPHPKGEWDLDLGRGERRWQKPGRFCLLRADFPTPPEQRAHTCPLPPPHLPPSQAQRGASSLLVPLKPFFAGNCQLWGDSLSQEPPVLV